MSTRSLTGCASLVLALSMAVPASAQNATVFAFTNGSSVAQLVVQTSSGDLVFDQASTCTTTTPPCSGQGWYGHAPASPGKHDAANLNYIATISGVRDYFVFDLGLGGEAVLGAYLHLWNPGGALTPGYQDTGGHPSALFSLWDITSSLDSVMSNNVGGKSGQAIWDDLGSGVNYGSRIVSALDNGHFADIALNSDALSAISLNARIGFGGTLVSEPETYTMLLAGLGLLGFAARRRKPNPAA